MSRNAAIILAAGSGERSGLNYNKVFHVVEKPLLSYSLATYDQHPEIRQIVVVGREDEIDAINGIVTECGCNKVSATVVGGATRQESCAAGFAAVADVELVAVHDAARPFVTADVISATLADAREHGVSVAAVPSKDTVKLGNTDGLVEQTPERESVWIVQTPQVLRSEILHEAHSRAREDGFVGTDDVSLAERIGYKVKLTRSNYGNIKVTTPEDLQLAELVLQKRGQS